MISNKQIALLLSVLLAPIVSVAGGTEPGYMQRFRAATGDYARRAAARPSGSSWFEPRVAMHSKIAGLEEAKERAYDKFMEAERNGTPEEGDKALRAYEEAKSALLNEKRDAAVVEMSEARALAESTGKLPEANRAFDEARREYRRAKFDALEQEEKLALARMSEARFQADPTGGLPKDDKAFNDAREEFRRVRDERDRALQKLNEMETQLREQSYEPKIAAPRQSTGIRYQASPAAGRPWFSGEWRRQEGAMPERTAVETKQPTRRSSWRPRWRNRKVENPSFDVTGESIRARQLRNKAREEELKRATSQLEEPTSY